MTERKKIITAGLWVLGAFGISQLIRLGGNLIVTRLLAPEMFGVMAIIFVVMHGLAMFSDLGFRVYIIRHENSSDSNMLSTIWTMQVIRGWLMFVVVGIIALLVFLMNHVFMFDMAEVYQNKDLPLLLIIIGVTAVITGYTTMAPALMDRELKRGRIELIELSSQVIATSIMVFWAWQFPSIWALVSAAVIAAILKMLLIYKFFDLRHQLSWDKAVVKDVFKFGKWIFIASTLTYFAMQGDRLIFSTYLSAAELGVYSIAFMLATVVSNILEQMASKVWFPALSRVVNSKPEELKKKYYEVRLKQDLFIFLIIGIMIAASPDVIGFLYDQRYHDASWMMQILLVGIIGLVISRLGIACLTALGNTKIRMKIMFVRTFSLLLGLPILFHYYGFEGAVWGVALNNFIALPVQYIEMYKQDILSVTAELKMVPLVIVGYYSYNSLAF